MEQDLEFHWQIVNGTGTLEGIHNQAVMFHASEEPGLTRLKVTARQHDVVCEAEALVTLTHEILSQIGASNERDKVFPAIHSNGRPVSRGDRALICREI